MNFRAALRLVSELLHSSVMYLSTRSAVVVLLAACGSFAQSPEPGKSGFTWYESLDGSFNSLGAVTRLDNSVGYNFGSHFSVDAGLPVYFVRPSSSTGAPSATGIGNIYAQLRLTLASDAVNFASILTGTAPTGDKATGLSTGHATVDWSNDFERAFGRVTPFGEIGFANSISDTLFFVRPYATQGLVTHAQGGLRIQLAKMFSVGASVYGIEPSGQQTVVSRVLRKTTTTTTTTMMPGSSAAPASQMPAGNGKQGVFETATLTTGSSSIDRDYGYSAWSRFTPASGLDFHIGYTRSAEYALNTLFLGVGMRLDKVFRR